MSCSRLPAPVCRCPAAAEILEGVLPASFHSRLAYLSGPSFAAEVAKQLPTVVTIAAKVWAHTVELCALLSWVVQPGTAFSYCALAWGSGSLRHTVATMLHASKLSCACLCGCGVLQDESVAARVQTLLSTPRFRCYRTTDVTGVELGGALKNVLAIACGEHTHTHLCHPGKAAASSHQPPALSCF